MYMYFQKASIQSELVPIYSDSYQYVAAYRACLQFQPSNGFAEPQQRIYISLIRVTNHIYGQTPTATWVYRRK